MKKIIYITIVLISLIFQSCGPLPDEITEPRQYGIYFQLVNNTNKEIENTRVIIGAINDNNEFVEIDTYSLPKIKKGSEIILGSYKDTRWQPDFDKIKEIGDGKAYLKFQFENRSKEFIEYDGDDRNLYIDLIRHEEIYDEVGNIILYIGEYERDLNGDGVVGWTTSMLNAVK